MEWIEFHSFIGHNPEVFAEIAALGPPYDIYVHDYSWFCPRVTLLTGREHHYCGEPDAQVCQDCVSDYGSNIEEAINPADLFAKSLRLFRNSRRIVAPSHDTANRFSVSLLSRSIEASGKRRPHSFASNARQGLRRKAPHLSRWCDRP